MVLKDLYYTETHEWVKVDGNQAYIGITDYAQHELGDIVYIELPDEGDEVMAGEAFGSIEAVKAVEDLVAPISGEVLEVNTDLVDTPELINKSPYEDGWLIKIKIADKSELDQLLDFEAYEEIIKD
ncbi:MAG: glycine cleavage system protein GcvH [Candidatus Cloacimonetes bacterium]|nr:glycine cleavage system protein GcvH [Candidatus Cloacimonadota bacterium]